MKELKEILSHLQTAYELLSDKYCPQYADIHNIHGIIVNKCYQKCPLHAILECREFVGMDWDLPQILETEECLKSILELAIDSIKETLEKEASERNE